jgi:hypothetical protein
MGAHGRSVSLGCSSNWTRQTISSVRGSRKFRGEAIAHRSPSLSPVAGAILNAPESAQSAQIYVRKRRRGTILRRQRQNERPSVRISE